MKARAIISLALAVCGLLAAASSANAGAYTVGTCQSVSGPLAGPVPVNISSGRFSAETGCRVSGGQHGYHLQPTNQGSGQNAVRTEWAGLQWQIPAGVTMSRAWAELGGTSANGSGSGFSPSSPWMFRTFGLGYGGADLFAARFSVPNNSYWFNPSDAPGLYGFYWGNSAGGLGTPAQWNFGQPYSLIEANGVFSRNLLPDWARSPIANNSALIPRLTGQIPTGPYAFYRVELRCATEQCNAGGFSQVRLQKVTFTMDDPLSPVAVTAAAEPGAPGSVGSRLLAGQWLSDGLLPVRWSGSDGGTGISGARVRLTPGPLGNLVDSPCGGGRPGQVRTSFKPCAESGAGTINLDVGLAPQGRSQVSVCAEDGVTQSSCSSGFTLRRDSVAPVIDAPAMKLTGDGGAGFTLEVDNPDHSRIAADDRAPLDRLTFTVEKKAGSSFVPVTSRIDDVSAQGSAAAILASGIDLSGDGTYRVCARLRDTAGNSQAGLSCTNLTVDDAIPDTTIVTGPRTLTGDPLARFGYTSDRPADAGFECRVDRAAWIACPGPTVDDPFEVTLSGSGADDGEHIFEVRAWLPPGTSGTSRRVDPTPAEWRWTLDRRPPDTEIITGPPPVSTEDVTFTFRSTEPGTFECSMDSVEWKSCTTPASYVGLARGDHIFRVRAIDLVGLVDPTPAERQFTVVPKPPVVIEKPVPVPSRKYCALTEFTIRPVARGIRATITAKRYSRFVRIQLFRDTPAVRRALKSGTYRDLPMYTATGPILNLKRKAIRNERRSYFFPKINLRTYPALYDFHGSRLIAVPRVSNEWTRCTLRYRHTLRRKLTGLRGWKKKWGIGRKFRLDRRR